MGRKFQLRRRKGNQNRREKRQITPMLFNKAQGNLLLYIYCNIYVYTYKVYALNHIYILHRVYHIYTLCI